ncbi:hypothetical protein FRB96_009470 [Tulasnella sp. 330]|nr:hypothetical protein FRB96_009470 [Tulasnella sp. 330]
MIVQTVRSHVESEHIFSRDFQLDNLRFDRSFDIDSTSAPLYFHWGRTWTYDTKSMGFNNAKKFAKSMMGAGQSKPGDTTHVFTNDTPIQVVGSGSSRPSRLLGRTHLPNDNSYTLKFSQDLVNHLADNLASPQTDPVRQSTLDAHVRSRIQAELTRLQAEESQVRQEIEQALEKENLDREVDLIARKGDEGQEDAPTSSAALQADLEHVQQRAERFIARKKLDDLPEVKVTQEALIQCYR